MSNEAIDVDLGFTVALDMPFEEAAQWAADEGFDFVELLDRYPAAEMTLDTSHALLAGIDEAGTAEFCRTNADRIAHLHLVDTRGGDDEHLPVGMGIVDVATVFAGLADAGWAGTATLEVGTTDFDTIALAKDHVEDLLEAV